MILAIIIAFTGFFIFVSSVSADSLVINEFMAKPIGENEWVEILNTTSANVDLTNWVLQEKTLTTGVFNSYNFPNVLLFPNSLCFYEFSSSKLNDSGDTINLLNPVGIQQDTYTYTNAIPGKTFSRVPDGGTWTENSNPTKTSNCSILTASSPAPSPTSTTSTVSTFTVSSVPSEIDSAQNFKVNINLSLPNNQNTDYYLKGAFKKVGAARYFGMTKVGSSWINYGSDLSNQLKITTNSSGQWSGDIEVQPDVLDNDYEGTGDYIFKVARYTTSNSLSWSNEANIKINAKEVEDQGGVIDLSKLSSKDTPKVLGETKKEAEKLPEEIYSLENYKKKATISSTPSASQTIEIKKHQQNLSLPIIGGLFLVLGLGFTVYKIYRNRVKL